MKIAVVLGTRPEIIKMSPIIKELEKRRADYFIVHTGQHYSFEMDAVFFEQLRLPVPRCNLEVGSGSHGEQTARILAKIEKVFSTEKPDVVLVQGDTNTALAGALAAVKMHIKVGHIEAGLRSQDRKMPEEINRILADHCSDYLFAPTQKAWLQLKSEGIPEAMIHITGNTIVDAVYQNVTMAHHAGKFIEGLHLKPGAYFLATLHRQENVDDPGRFVSILQGLEQVSDKYQLPVIYPIHPRSQKRMAEYNLKTPQIIMTDPVDFWGFLKLEKDARLILTDSGGIQEESCILGVPCVTLRDTTERPETLEVKANILAGTTPEKILECTGIMLDTTIGWNNPFGDGRAGEKIVQIIETMCLE